MALILAGATGVWAFDSAYPLDDAWRGVFFIGLPTVIASLFTAPLDRMLGGQLTNNGSSLLALISEVILIVVLLVAGFLSYVLGFTQQFVLDALIVGLAAIFAFRLIVLQVISQRKSLRSMLPASIQTVAAAVLLFVYSGTLYYFRVGGPLLEVYFARPSHTALQLQGFIYPFDFVLLTITSALYGIAVVGFLQIVDWPWRSSLGVSVLDFMHGFIGYLAGNSQQLEEFFVEIGEQAIVPLAVLSFRPRNGDEKARFVLPMVHPGPMGDIGGGSLPLRLKETAEGLSFAPHATAGHDFNLVTEREVETICERVEQTVEEIEYTDTATRGVRITEGEATLTGHAFDDDALMINTFSPTAADDVEYSVGLAGVSKAQASGLDDVLLVDAHNCNDGLEGEEIGHVVPGSKLSFDLINGTERLGERLQSLDRNRLEMGVAWDETPWSLEEGIGPLGIRVSVLQVGEHQTAYVLFDGNNMEPGLRERIVDSIDSVEMVEIMTSDTHVVNRVDAENQVGQEIPWEETCDLVQSLIDDAIDDLEPVEAGMATERVEVTVFGNDRTETLASHANAMIPMATGLGVAFILTVLSLSTILFLLVENVPA